MPAMNWKLKAAQKPGRMALHACGQARRERTKRQTSRMWRETYNEVRQSLDQRMLRKVRRLNAKS